MQLHWGWATIAALALGTGLAWWLQPARTAPAGAADPDRRSSAHPRNAHDTGAPTLYRWVDAGGVVNISTAHPPAGRPYTIVQIDPNQNIVPMPRSDSATKAATKPH